MNINKQKLIELLTEKTGMEQSEVEEQLDQLIKRIIDAAERGKALEIKEFGLFYFDENGDLKFDPSKELSTEINFKYAGMEPVELKAPRDSSTVEEGTTEKEESTPEITVESDSEKEEELDDIFGLDDVEETEEDSDVYAGLDTEDELDEQPRDENPIVSKADKVERELDPFSGLLGDASSKLSKSGTPPEDEEDNFIFDEPVEEPKTSVAKEPPSVPEPKAKKHKPTKKQPAKTEEPTRDPIMVVLSVVLVFILVTAGFFIIPALFPEEPQDPENNTVTEQLPEEEETMDSPTVLTPVEPSGTDEVVSDEVEEPVANEVEEIEPEQPRYGLEGEFVEAANDGFSIVLHSLRNESNARNQAATLALEGYRVLVSPRTVNDETVWRVSVGQFPSIEDAQEVASELPSPYNSNNFIQRIQIN